MENLANKVSLVLMLLVSIALHMSGNSAQAVIVDIPLEGESSSRTNQVTATPSEETKELIKARMLGATEFPFWKHVGMVGMGTGVYLGDGYVLTSAHVGCYPFRLTDGSYYQPNYKSWTILNDGEGNQSDLAIFRVFYGSKSRLAELQRLPIASAAPKEDEPLLLFGSGLKQMDEPSTLRSNGKIVAVLGYRSQAKRAMTWGFNTVSEMPGQTIQHRDFKTHCFLTRFDNQALEAQAAAGDSGGASFFFNADLERWELAGCIIGVTQNDTYIPFGSRTFLANLASYRQQLPFVEEIQSDPVEITEVAPVEAISETETASAEKQWKMHPAVILCKIPE